MLLTAAGIISWPKVLTELIDIFMAIPTPLLIKIHVFCDVFDAPEERVAAIFRVRQHKSACLFDSEDGGGDVLHEEL